MRKKSVFPHLCSIANSSQAFDITGTIPANSAGQRQETGGILSASPAPAPNSLPFPPMPSSSPPAIARRAILRAGPLGLFATTSLARVAPVAAVAAAPTTGILHSPGFGRARRCLLLFMWGGPSQLDTLDLKPSAPAEVRGEFRPVSTATPGLQICEHFRHLAALSERIAVVRSLCHDDPAHLSSAHTTLTGSLPPVNKSDDEPPSRRDSPHVSVVAAEYHPAAPGMPGSVMLPWKTLHPAAPGGVAPGQTGGWLGSRRDPLLVTGDPAQPNWQAPALQLLDGLDSRRLHSRQQLLDAVDTQQRRLHQIATAADLTSQQLEAFRLLAGPAVRQAFDLTRETDSTRDRYGRNIHGQCVLLARRLLEFGVPFVTVNWHNDGRNFWDTHGNNFQRLKNDLIPPADQALSAVLSDLEDRGMLADTLVIWTGEFGRRPQITASNAGREHHPWCYSGLLAGGGVRGGAIYGASDEIARFPREKPVSPHDLTATILHSLGIPPDATLSDATGRPHQLYHGKPITEIFS